MRPENIPKNLVIVGGTISFLILSLLIGYYTWARPSFVVGAPVGSTVTISTLQGKQVITQKITNPSTTLRVDPGQYVINLTHTSGAQSEHVDLGLFGHKEITATVEGVLKSQLVANTPARTVLRSGTSLSYLDPLTHWVKIINQDGQISIAPKTTANGTDSERDSSVPGGVRTMLPIVGNRAIVQEFAQLFVLQNGQLQALAHQSPPSNIKPSAVIVGTNPGQESFAVAINKALFWYESPSTKPQKILDLPANIDKLVVGGTKVLAYSTRLPDSKEDIKASYAAFAIDPILIDVQTKTQQRFTNGPIVDASLSSNGKLVIIHKPGQQSMLYDTQKNTTSRNVESSDTTIVWLDDHQYAYSKGAELWKFDTNKNTSTQLAQLPQGVLPTSVTYDRDSYYITTYNGEDNAAIFVISKDTDDASSKAAAAIAYKDPNFEFTFSFINVTTPIITITTTPLQSYQDHNELAVAIQTIRSKAISKLKEFGVDISKVTIRFNPDPL